MAKRIKHMADWSKLPKDLLGIIANKLSAIEDFVCFSSVCSSWRSSVPKQEWRRNPCIPRLPWLLLTKYQDRYTRRNSTTTTRSLKRFMYDMERNKLYPVNNSLLDQYYTTNGWIFNTQRYSSRLIDPLTGFQITLPPIYNAESLAKVLVSPRRPSSDSDDNCSTNNDDIVVFVNYFECDKLRFARPGFQEWIPLENDFFYDNDEDIYFGDVVCYKGRVFAVRSNGVLVLCEIDCPSPKAIDIAPPPPLLKYRDVYACYLVESREDLLFVIEYDKHDTAERAFEVYKFNWTDNGGGRGIWTKLGDLGGCTLFLSYSYSVSVLPTDQVDCRADCIYCTTFNCRLRVDCYLNVFDMKDKTTEHYSLTNLSDFRGSAWVMPSFGFGLGNA